MAKLTAKQKRFIEEYLIDLNATQAAIRAIKAGANVGVFSCPGYLVSYIFETSLQQDR